MSTKTLAKFKEYAKRTNSGWIEAAIEEIVLRTVT